MQALCVWLPLLLQVLLLTLPSLSSPARPLTQGDLEEMEAVPAEVIIRSSPCSATCGLGVKSQTLCVLKDGKTGMEGAEERRDEGKEEREEVERGCRLRQVTCLESWQCGLRTVTVTAGQRLEMDCLGHVMQAMGRYAWRVSWRRARGIITSDNSLFSRWEAPQIDTVVLDPVREDDAGTYRCDVQDSALRRVKRVYRGVRVLPRGVLNLDYDSSLARWDWTGSDQNLTVVSERLYHSRTVRDLVLISIALSALLATLILSGLYCLLPNKGMTRRRGGEEEGVQDRLLVPLREMGGDGGEEERRRGGEEEGVQDRLLVPLREMGGDGEFQTPSRDDEDGELPSTSVDVEST